MPALANPVVLYEGRSTVIETRLPDPNDLWVAADTLAAVNGFELKPEGACLEDICVPVNREDDGALHVTRDGMGWFNVTELARRLDQPVVVDRERDVWALGPVPAARNRFEHRKIAPDFVLPDQHGAPVRLSAHRDMKVILLTWASW